jgi:hypothetical protein
MECSNSQYAAFVSTLHSAVITVYSTCFEGLIKLARFPHSYEVLEIWERIRFLYIIISIPVGEEVGPRVRAAD